MSSVAPLPTLTLVAGDGLVNARALDGIITQVVAEVNALVAYLEANRGVAEVLKDDSVRDRMLSAVTQDFITQTTLLSQTTTPAYLADDIGRPIVTEMDEVIFV
jgi:hypothetical protein